MKDMIKPRNLLVISGLLLLGTSCKKKEVVCDGSSPTYTSEIKGIIDASCVSCHSEYSTYAGVKASVNNGSFESEVISKQTMPRDGKLSESQLSKIKCWLEQGAKEN